MTLRVGNKVYFGRPNGEQTLGEVVKVNRKSVKVKTLEDRGRTGRSQAGVVWRVPPSLCRLAEDTEAPSAASTVPRRPQRQDSLTDQLNDLVGVANRMGMYDAADFIRNHLSRMGNRG
jgi:hypothetical protein